MTEKDYATQIKKQNNAVFQKTWEKYNPFCKFIIQLFFDGSPVAGFNTCAFFENHFSCVNYPHLLEIKDGVIETRFLSKMFNPNTSFELKLDKLSVFRLAPQEILITRPVALELQEKGFAQVAQLNIEIDETIE